MDNNKFHIAYSIDNQFIAEEIYNHLSRVGVDINLIKVDHQIGETSLQERLKTAPNYVLILISTNFLKNVNCMSRGLFMLQELTLNNRVQPIIIDGREPIEGSNAFQNVPTEYGRMTHVIRYMNYWQDHYLDLRKQRREIPEDELEKFDEQLKVIRSISSEMGDFLKLLKNSNTWTYDQLTHNAYELFFQAMNKPGLHEALQKAIANGEIPTPVMEAEQSNPSLENSTDEDSSPENELISEEGNSANELLEKIPEETVLDSSVASVEEKIEENQLNQEIVEEIVEDISSDTIPVDSKLEETNLAVETLETDTDDNDEMPTSDQIQEEIEQDLLRISEENLKQKGKVPLLDKLIEHRKRDEQHKVMEIESISNESSNLKIVSKQENIENNNLEIAAEVEDKDIVFENAVNRVLEEESQIELEEENTTTELEEKENTNENNSKNVIRSHPILNEIFHDDDDELDSDDMIGSFTLSSSSATPKTEEKEEQEVVKVSWQDQLKKAKDLIEKGKLYAGLNLMREITEEHDDKVELKYEYAMNLLKDDDNTKAAQTEFEKVIQQDPQHANAYIQLSNLAVKSGDYIQSRKHLEKAIEIDFDNADLYYQLGILITTKFPHDQEKAANYFKTSIKIDDKNPDVHYRYGLILDEHLKEPKKALKEFEITKELQNDHPFVSYDLALMHYRFGEFAKAADYYKEACAINPELKTETNDRAFLGAVEAEAIDEATTSLDDLFQDLSESSVEEEDYLNINNSSDENNDVSTKDDEAPPKSENFEKVVLISGATSGIGKATATLFAQNGYRLILTGRRNDRLESIKTQFEEDHPTEVQILNFDVRKMKAAEEAINSLPEEWRSIDLLINNAGLAKGFEPIHEGKLEDWETMIDTNVKGLLYLTRLISPGMVKRRKGHIINVCSTAGHEVYPNGNVYCATKHAVDALTKGMRLDFYKHGLRVSQVSPAHVEETEFARVRFDWDEERAKIYEDFQPLRAEDVANTIYFIATQPAHVNIQDVLMMGRQQANSSNLDRSGR